MHNEGVVCRGCGVEKSTARWGQWWHVNGYHGFRGSFCPECYDKISHDSYGNPVNPGEHLLMTLRLLGDKGK